MIRDTINTYNPYNGGAFQGGGGIGGVSNPGGGTDEPHNYGNHGDDEQCEVLEVSDWHPICPADDCDAENHSSVLRVRV